MNVAFRLARFLWGFADRVRSGSPSILRDPRAECDAKGSARPVAASERRGATPVASCAPHSLSNFPWANPPPLGRSTAWGLLVAFLVLLLVLAGGCARLLPPPRGLWVLNEGSNRTLDSKERIDELLATAKRYGVSELFVQVYRGNRAWYPSILADDEPSRRAAIPGYVSPLQYLIDQARPLNLRVHAWVNIFRIAGNRKATILKRLGPEIVLVDNSGTSMLKYEKFRIPGEPGRYFALGTHGYWLDPGSERVQRYLLDVLGELLRSHPRLDGVHFDFVRYPYVVPINPGVRFARRVDFGYGGESRARFELETNQSMRMRNGSYDAPRGWNAWRRRQVTDFVRRAHRFVKQQNPNLALSAAVIPWADRAYLSAFQDWRGWLDEGLIDFAVVMAYSKDTKLVRQMSRQAVAARGAGRVYIGLGAYMLLDDPKTLRRQHAAVAELNPDGIVYFSYDSILKRRDILSTLKDRLWDLEPGRD